jgi:uncharacterized membrane protein YbhN (UPF0104 family)
LPGRLGEVAQALQSRIETINWNRIGIALSATIITASGIILYFRLRDLDWHAVAGAIAATPAGHIAAAALFAAGGYVTLGFYDWFALRTIGARQVPVWTAALAGTTSYAIGHGIGAMVVASAAIRYRIYSRFGLGVVDIAKLCFVAGLTFWLGNVTALSLGMAYMPEAAEAVDRIPPWLNQVIGIGGLCGLAGYLAWVWPKPRMLGRNGSSVALPSGWMTATQIGIGLADMSCCSLAMYLLMPALPEIDFIPLAVAVVFGTLLGFASHAPGGIGALDAVMLIALPGVDQAQVVATLLLYRMLYFVVPFAIALAGLGIREIVIHWRK